MADEILKEMTHLGSTLAGLANSQLNTVLNELRGEAGSTTPNAAGRPPRVNAGTLTANALQFVNKVGQLLTELSKYDLVRNDAAVVALYAPNPLRTVTLQYGHSFEYQFLVEHGGTEKHGALELELKATLTRAEDGKVTDVSSHLTPNHALLARSERRRFRIELALTYFTAVGAAAAAATQAPEPTDYVLRIEALHKNGAAHEKVGSQCVAIQVLPPPTEPQ